MTYSARGALWVSGWAVVSGFIVWLFSFSGAAFLSFVVGLDLPGWLAPPFRAEQLRWAAIGLLVAFVIGLLVVRYLSAPSQVWLGALATSVLLGGRYLVGAISIWRLDPIDDGWHDLLYSAPFHDPYVALLVLVCTPAVVALACWLAARWSAHSAQPSRPSETRHA